MPDVGFPVEVISGVPVVAVPQDIDITNAAGLRTALLEAAVRGHGTFVVDMSRTQFCDTAGIHALVAAHKRARAEGGQLLLVTGGAAVRRIITITGLDRVIPNFSSLEQALAHVSAPPGQPPSAGTL